MDRSNRRGLAQSFSFDVEDDELRLAACESLSGGESRTGQLTGTRALMLAVLEDGIRSFLGNSRLLAQDAEYWIYSHRRHSPFSFVVVCEILGLDPDAVRRTLTKMKEDNVSPRQAIPRARHNVRVPGRVHPRRH